MDKKEIVLKAKQLIKLRIEELQKAIKNTQDSANQESKSSAGDKYETSRAMAQNDKFMYDTQLLAANAELNVLDTIKFDQEFVQIRQGALVKTNIGTFMIAISIGKITLGTNNIMVISQESPIGKLIFGKMVSDKISFNGNQIEILSID